MKEIIIFFMPPRFGNLTNPSMDIVKEIKSIGRLGFDFAELGFEEPLGRYDTILRKRKNVLDAIKKYNLFVTGHAPWWAELGTTNEAVRKGWLIESKKVIVTANKLGIKKLNFHTHSRGLVLKVQASKKQVLNNYVTSLRKLVNCGKKYGVKIIVENPVERGEITNLKDIEYIVNNVYGLGVTLDVGHAFVRGGMKYIKDFANLFEDRIEHIHMSDNHGKNDEHLPIGKGIIDYKKVVKILKKMDYNKTITLEVFTSRKDAVESKEKILKLWQK